MTARGLWLACFCIKNATVEGGDSLWNHNEFIVKDLMVLFYLHFSAFFSERQFVQGNMWAGWKAASSSGVQSIPILCITVLKPLALSDHAALGVCCFEWLVDMWNCSCKAQHFRLWHLFLADIYKFTTFMALRNYLWSPGGRWVMCVNGQ